MGCVNLQVRVQGARTSLLTGFKLLTRAWLTVQRERKGRRELERRGQACFCVHDLPDLKDMIKQISVFFFVFGLSAKLHGG